MTSKKHFKLIFTCKHLLFVSPNQSLYTDCQCWSFCICKENIVQAQCTTTFHYSFRLPNSSMDTFWTIWIEYCTDYQTDCSLIHNSKSSHSRFSMSSIQSRIFSHRISNQLNIFWMKVDHEKYAPCCANMSSLIWYRWLWNTWTSSLDLMKSLPIVLVMNPLNNIRSQWPKEIRCIFQWNESNCHEKFLSSCFPNQQIKSIVKLNRIGQNLQLSIRPATLLSSPICYS